VYVAVITRRSVLPHLISIDARQVGTGEQADTVCALRDMSIAAGISSVPRLFVVPDAVSFNAFVMGRTPELPVIVVTSALAERTGLELKRAVFANLLARFRDGGVRWTTDLFMVMAPIRTLLAQVHVVSSRVLDEMQMVIAWLIVVFAVGLFEFLSGTLGVNVVGLGLLLLAVTLSAVCFITTLYALDRSYRGAYRRLVYSADADGVMLLKDPEMAVGALKAVLGETTWMIGGWRYLYLTYADAGYPITVDGVSELDRARLGHLSALAFPAQSDGIPPLPLLRGEETQSAP
jgi:hypothetical protein